MKLGRVAYQITYIWIPTQEIVDLHILVSLMQTLTYLLVFLFRTFTLSCIKISMVLISLVLIALGQVKLSLKVELLKAKLV
jgi:hypothetical protein